MKAMDLLGRGVAACLFSAAACSSLAGTRSNVRPDDPLYGYQWQWDNRGQPVFADLLPSPRIDLNIGEVHRQGIRGKGAIVAVVDSGVDLDHEDLRANVIPGGSMDYESGSRDARDVSGHGTAVAGVLAASGWNGKGVRGVAPEAALKSFNAYEVLDFSDHASEKATFRRFFGQAWGEGEEAKDVDIFNNSVGLRPDGRFRSITQADVVEWEQLMRTTRGGLGGIYVWAAGNGFMQPPGLLSMDDADQNAGCHANTLGLSCALAEFDYPSAFIHVISVGSVNSRGTRSYFSSAGASLWVVAPGGEDGGQRAVLGARDRGEVFGPGTLTTDISGCEAGFNTLEARQNHLDGGTAVDPHCNYAAAFSGTSAAAPMVSGVVALMLQANPGLTQRDVKFILARTARHIDPGQPPVRYKGILLEPGWTSNAAGYRFSNWYGFGLVDASAAVSMALGFPPLPRAIDSGWMASKNEPVPISGSRAPATMRVRVTKNMRVEAVQVSMDTSHDQPRRLLVTLTSPSGTVSRLLTPFTVLEDGANFSIPLTASNAFFEESARGFWKLSVIDVEEGARGALNAFRLRVVGHR